MKSSLLFASLVAAAALATGALFAADTPKEVTISGEGKCAKCEMGETPSCQNAVEVKQGDKSVVYYLADNQVSKDFHRHLCTVTAPVTATGTVEVKDGKHVLTASKIELAK